MNEHYSVMAEEAIDLLQIKENGIYVDGTLGRGGHSRLILERLKKGKLIAFDLDDEAIKKSRINLSGYENVTLIHDNFAHMGKYVNQVDGILLDLGVSSPQFDEGDRGFSYRFDAPLDMRMDQSQKLDAYQIVNTYDVTELSRIFKEYGEEKFAYKIACNIEKRRQIKPIQTTWELVDVIKGSLPAKVLAQKGHPAKQCFQALRIAVNGELDSLAEFLESFGSLLKPGGRAVIITFHSLEDRMVKQAFKKMCSVEDDLRIDKRPEEIKKADYFLLNHKALTASSKELEENSRSKSAKLRGICKRD